jgi:hypothetical protein
MYKVCNSLPHPPFCPPLPLPLLAAHVHVHVRMSASVCMHVCVHLHESMDGQIQIQIEGKIDGPKSNYLKTGDATGGIRTHSLLGRQRGFTTGN